MRGFGAVQVCFAAEAQMDILAAELGIDPIELRLLNAIESGDTLPTGQVLTGSLPVAEVIRAAAAIPVPEPEPLPRDPIRLPGGAGNTTRGEGVRRGVGFAVGFKNICFSEGFDDYCSARVQLRADGSADRPLRRGRGRPGGRRRDPAGRRAPSSGRATSPSRRSTTAHGRLGRVDLGLADDLDGGRCRPGRVPGRARGARDAAAAAEIDVERIYRHAPHVAARPGDRPGARVSAHTSRSRRARCASSPRSTSSSG